MPEGTTGITELQKPPADVVTRQSVPPKRLNEHRMGSDRRESSASESGTVPIALTVPRCWTVVPYPPIVNA